MIAPNDFPVYVKVGKYTSVANDVTFHRLSDEHQWSINHKCVYTTNWNQAQGDGEIVLGNDVWIGAGARIMNGVVIGDGAIVGAGAVVVKDIPPYTVVVGNPARVRRYRFTKAQRDKLTKIKWFEWSDDLVRDRINDMLDIDVFLSKYG